MSVAVPPDELYERAERELAALNARIIEVEVQRRLASEKERLGLVPRDRFEGVSGWEVMTHVLVELERASSSAAGTFVGAHQIVRRVCVELGVPGAEAVAVFRRTRAQVDAAPNPDRPREGMARATDQRVAS